MEIIELITIVIIKSFNTKNNLHLVSPIAINNNYKIKNTCIVLTFIYQIKNIRIKIYSLGTTYRQLS